MDAQTSAPQRDVIKMSNGQGHVEWYMGLSVRTQSLSVDEARTFTRQAAAEEKATEITRPSMLAAFSGAFFVDGGWYIEATVEPLP